MQWFGLDSSIFKQVSYFFSPLEEFHPPRIPLPQRLAHGFGKTASIRKIFPVMSFWFLVFTIFNTAFKYSKPS